ncbi:MAG: hypothetical protein PHD20_02920 [Clostridia bacterium]|nr:hypothetical protein [Clostridia bacterium]
MDDKNIIFCDICGSSFDSNCKMFCKKCEYYNEGLSKFGRTITNEECQLELLKKEIIRITV